MINPRMRSNQGDRSVFNRPRCHEMEFGAQVQPEGGVRFNIWAPSLSSVRLALRDNARIDQTLAMHARGDGWFERCVAEARAGSEYKFLLPDGTGVPDPASRFQPDDVHGFSEVIDPAAYSWKDGSWVARPWHETVIYELHIGTFTATGTFRGASERLDHLQTLGVTAIELMPVADFPGARNWGYDGVFLFAPDSSYGRPEDFKALIEAAHTRGIMVFLDVVYNHFGPEGNYLPLYAPNFFTERHKTPWGAAVNYETPDARWVREFVIHNALFWLEEYNLDGLRLDAVHAILDDSAKHLLTELAERVRAAHGRHVHILVENEENESHYLTRESSGTIPLYSAQWNDDVHHVLHVAVTGEAQGYYSEYLNQPDKLARALAEGFAFQGELMASRGETRGQPSAWLPPSAFVAFIQNHDQVGNRAFGERITSIAPTEAVRAIAAVYLLLPQVPMLFMGEEWGAAQPFPFFCDFTGDLADAVRKGRREEFAKFPEFNDETVRARIPDPQARETFESAKLDWSAITGSAHAAWLELYKRLLKQRCEKILPLLPHIPGNAGRYEISARGALIVSWELSRGGRLTLEANLSKSRIEGFATRRRSTVLWQEGTISDTHFEPWSVRWSVSEANQT